MNANRRDWDEFVKGGSYNGVNTSRGTQIQVVKVSNEFRGFDITLIFPGILFIAVPLPFDEEL